MMNKLAICILLLSFIIQLVSGAVCEPDCLGVANDTKIADPYNCHNFYFCRGDVTILNSVSCPVGEVFDDATKDCVVGTSCDNECDVQPLVCQVIQTDCTSLDPSNTGCTFADISDCSKYFVCSLEAASIKLTCTAPNSFYNGVACVSDSSQCCANNSLCVPYCTQVGTLIADPCDCHSYYICSSANKIPELMSTCNPGENFMTSSNQCETDPDDELCFTTCPIENC